MFQEFGEYLKKLETILESKNKCVESLRAQVACYSLRAAYWTVVKIWQIKELLYVNKSDQWRNSRAFFNVMLFAKKETIWYHR